MAQPPPPYPSQAPFVHPGQQAPPNPMMQRPPQMSQMPMAQRPSLPQRPPASPLAPPHIMHPPPPHPMSNSMPNSMQNSLPNYMQNSMPNSMSPLLNATLSPSNRSPPTMMRPPQFSHQPSLVQNQGPAQNFQPRPQMPPMPPRPQMPPGSNLGNMRSPTQPTPSQPSNPQPVQQFQQPPTAPPMTHRASYDNVSAAGTPRINTALMPSVINVLRADVDRFESGNRPYFTSQYGEEPLPMTSTDVQIIDNGNSSCRFVRSTAYQFPGSEEQAEQCKVPAVLVFQPFAEQPAQEIPVPLVHFGTEMDPKTGKALVRGPPRCNRCRGYVNPRVTFEKGGRGWRCNLCTFLNDVPDWYFYDIDASGRRLDIAAHPELQNGTFDIVASPDYTLRKNIFPARLVIGIDCSRACVQLGAFGAFVDAVKGILLAPSTPALYQSMALFLFDRCVTFVEASENIKEARIVVLPDISDPFVPNPGSSSASRAGGVFFDLSSSDVRSQVLRLLDLLPGMYAETRIVESCFGAAASIPFDALKDCGGRVVLMASSLPSFGPGALKNRELAVANNAGPNILDRVHPLFVPQGDFYAKLVSAASTCAVSYGLVLAPSSFIDIGTLKELTNSSAGFLLHYPKSRTPANPQSLYSRVRDDLILELTKPFIFDAIARLRCGPGFQEGACYGSSGPILTNTQLDQNFPCFTSDTSFAYKIDFDGKLSEGDFAHFQLAVLHTTPSGERRIRVINLSLPVAASPAQIFKYLDLEAILSYETKAMASRIITQPLNAISAGLLARSSLMLAAYRRFCTSAVSSGQLILPDALKLLPVFLLALSKSPGFQPGTASFDIRASYLRLLLDLPIDALLPLLYPRMISVHRIIQEEHPTDFVLSENLCRLSKDHIERTGLYLIENGFKLWFLVGDIVPPEVLVKLFNVPNIGQINPLISQLPNLNNPSSRELGRIIQELQASRSHYLDLQVVRLGIDTALEAEVLQSIMIEDSTPAGPSYVDFLCKLHGQIQHDVTHSSGSILSDKTALLSFLH